MHLCGVRRIALHILFLRPLAISMDATVCISRAYRASMHRVRLATSHLQRPTRRFCHCNAPQCRFGDYTAATGPIRILGADASSVHKAIRFSLQPHCYSHTAFAGGRLVDWPKHCRNITITETQLLNQYQHEQYQHERKK